MSETVEISKNKEIEEVETIEEIVDSLMGKVRRFSEKKTLRPEEIEEVEELLGKKGEIVVSVLVRFLYACHRRHREAALLVLGHPKLNFHQVLSTEELIPLREQVEKRVV